jgi:hypothetical protein
VRLSISTLKRIWGKVKYDHSPTTATLNAIARFAGFDGWRDFQQQNPGVAPAAPASVAVPHSAPQRGRRGFLAPLIIGTTALAALLSLLSARFIHMTAPNPTLRFESRSTSDDLPNSVVVDGEIRLQGAGAPIDLLSGTQYK